MVINLKNDNTKSIIYQNRVRNRYEYDENQPSIVWTLDNSTKKVLGYICNRATARYRGRNYIAWYTTDISKNNGIYF
jgi:GLPGLI family protein